MPTFLTPREAAEKLRISEKTLWNYTQPRGPIRKVQIGDRCVRYDEAELLEDVRAMRGQEQLATA
jgi:predicted DNA-binding transcriptional regulator AlpA